MRTVIVTGGASGIGKATAAALRARADHVITVDRSDADVIADLSLPAGRDLAIQKIKTLVQGHIDAVIVSAGISTGDAEAIVGVNFFGATQIVTGLRCLLQASSAPRVVLISSEAIIHPHDLGIVDACLAENEEEAKRAAASAPDFSYVSSKLALSYWVKQHAISAQWAGAGILMNAVAPGVVVTPMTQYLLDTEEGKQILNQMTPTRIGRPAQPSELAKLIIYLASSDNSYIVGQTIFCDGGAEATLRPHHI